MSFYGNAHRRVKQLWGSACLHTCVFCGNRADDWAYDGMDPTAGYSASTRCEYSNWPEFYMPLCTPCHMLFDGNWFSIVPRHRVVRSKPQPPRTEAEWDAWFAGQKARPGKMVPQGASETQVRS